jgi:hypothetical protein
MCNVNVKAGGTYSNHVCFEESTAFGFPLCYSLCLLKDMAYYEAEWVCQYRNSELINVFFFSAFIRVLGSSRKYNTFLTCPLTVVYFSFFKYDNSEIFIGLSLNRVFHYVFIVQCRAAYLACPVMFCSNSCSLQLTVSIWPPGNAYMPVHLCSPVYVPPISCGAASSPSYIWSFSFLPSIYPAVVILLFFSHDFNTLITVSMGQG